MGSGTAVQGPVGMAPGTVGVVQGPATEVRGPAGPTDSDTTSTGSNDTVMLAVEFRPSSLAHIVPAIAPDPVSTSLSTIHRVIYGYGPV